MEKIKKLTIRISEDDYERCKYWSGSKDISVNAFINDAISHYIAYQNKDYDLPTLEVQRLNQLVDNMYVLSSNVKSLESIIISGFESLLNLTRGDNYLLDEDY